ncbi:unnamed protein product [Clonostachys solani]|uniref:Uncharacterized protein n=1 Tax=Clonostachys solani TaxID=160281 RepID=A0A9N9YWJ6_9HYPO|nr:unnamed protein product [Clonostachys solani]
MGKNSKKRHTDPGTKKDANRKSKNTDFTISICVCVYNFAKGVCVRRIAFPGKFPVGRFWGSIPSQTGIWTKLEKKPTVLTTSCKTLIVTKWQEGFTGAGPITETLTAGSGDSWSLSPDGTYLAIQRASGVVIDIVALRRCI